MKLTNFAPLTTLVLGHTNVYASLQESPSPGAAPTTTAVATPTPSYNSAEFGFALPTTFPIDPEAVLSVISVVVAAVSSESGVLATAIPSISADIRSVVSSVSVAVESVIAPESSAINTTRFLATTSTASLGAPTSSSTSRARNLRGIPSSAVIAGVVVSAVLVLV